MRVWIPVLALLIACDPLPPEEVPDPSLPTDCDASDLIVAARTVSESGDVTSFFDEGEDVLVEVSVRNLCGNAVQLETSHSCLVPAIAISGELDDGEPFGTHYTAACDRSARTWNLPSGGQLAEVHRISDKPAGLFFAAVAFSSVDLAGASAFFEVLEEDDDPGADDDDGGFGPDPIDADPAVCDGDDLEFLLEVRDNEGTPRETFTTAEVVHAYGLVRNPCDEPVDFATVHLCVIPAWTVVGSAFAGSFAGCHEVERTVWTVEAQSQLEEGRPLETLPMGVYVLTAVASSPTLGAAAVEFRVVD
ncbi:MAG: hypothetical protein GY898_22610 [Proteobacteria bacterium]|nr:hypothetical protein [Pseudomonadota bacterium]